jgi:hypothetical protein
MLVSRLFCAWNLVDDNLFSAFACTLSFCHSRLTRARSSSSSRSSAVTWTQSRCDFFSCRFSTQMAVETNESSIRARIACLQASLACVRARIQTRIADLQPVYLSGMDVDQADGSSKDSKQLSRSSSNVAALSTTPTSTVTCACFDLVLIWANRRRSLFAYTSQPYGLQC